MFFDVADSFDSKNIFIVINIVDLLSFVYSFCKAAFAIYWFRKGYIVPIMSKRILKKYNYLCPGTSENIRQDLFWGLQY